ncbi:hypothetical protein [Novosphingobium pituita]|jgi:hypothetical protein|uniref:Lipoprotein n=1 Tax=Novosphingobium pituita TaxID=3056842 RepID=A0ABQ6P687_9SPHN|nr:hypothetical protein [Novosphingobium sp. IK01]MDK4805466.1 hypothetical protein [Novosphingobium aromaticivorans]GMM60763.1 hypothetical protein NUTIK01_15400 [Novosphingobium sp. IK01]HIQ16923.1 hypothetical protein [Novosphingobium capsulatum]
MKLHSLLCAGLLAACLPAAAHADDPNDRTMRSAAARARDHETIRRMNQAQLDYVRKRDARQAREWEASSTRSYEDADSYADAQAQYRRDLADWRRAVADCRAGYYDACGR